jgi:hypothetical protein
MQLEHQAAADHVSQLAVGLSPIPSLTQQLRQRSAARARVLGDELLDERDVVARDLAASVPQLYLHGEGSVQDQNVERKAPGA